MKNNEPVALEIIADKDVPLCSQCACPTESQQDPCSNRRTKQPKVAGVSPMPKPPCDGKASKELRIVLLGKTGAGKSATGNTLLNEDLFKSKSSMVTVTDKCQYAYKEIWGRNIMVVDTPGMLDNRMAKKQVDLEIKKSVVISSPGPHAFLLVISLSGRFTEEEQIVLGELEYLFGESIMKHLIVVFTHKEEIKDTTLEEYIEGSPDVLKQYLKAASGGCITFDNKGNAKEKEDDSKKLIARIDEMMKQNEGSHFTLEMFREAEELMQAKIAMELKKERLELQKEVEELRTEMKAMITTQQDKEETLGQLIHEEVERNEKKEKLLHQIEQTVGVERVQAKQQLAHVTEQIQQIVTKRRKVQEEVIDERMSAAVELRAQTLREEERRKVEEQEGQTLGM